MWRKHSIFRLFFKKWWMVWFWLLYVVGMCVMFYISDDSFSHPRHNPFHAHRRTDKDRMLKENDTSESVTTLASELNDSKAEANVDAPRDAATTRAHARPRPDNHATEVFREANPKTEGGWVPPLNAGEGGQGLDVKEDQLSKEQKEEFSRGYKLHRFNQFVSDHISLHRSVPRVHENECREQRYRTDLPSTSVIIIFHNEAWSTLLRTVHSVLDQSPPQVLKHVILVDDFSELDHLKKPLENYLSQPELRKVHVVRSLSREGLIKARLLGLSHVNTSVVVFLDSHCECFNGWLEPLLDRIAQDPTKVVVPVIDNIDPKTFAVTTFKAKDINVGTFSWALLFNWMPIQPGERRRRTSDIEPIRSPTMAGGLFAIDRAFFYKLGTYDPGFKIWGGENLELSFKIWMCGGALETIPCSHVGHVFRTTSPHSSGGFKNYLSTNLGRLAAVWLDEYTVYRNMLRSSRKVDDAKLIGDVSERLALRRHLQCHSFGWYMKHVMPEIYLPADRVAHGPIENKLTKHCIYYNEDDHGSFVELEPCQRLRIRSEMKWYMSTNDTAIFQEARMLSRTAEQCLDYSGGGHHYLSTFACHGMGGNQKFKYSKELKQLYHVNTRTCAKASHVEDPPRVVMVQCDPRDPLQQWEWDTSPVPGPSWRKDEAAGKPVL